jgi:hypothetical protein
MGHANERIERRGGRRRSKLTPALVQEIRRKYAAGELTQKELAAEYAVSAETINSLINGRSWKDVPMS